MKNTKRYAQRLSKVSEWLLKTKKRISLCLANYRVSPATAGCLRARHGFNGSAQQCPECQGWPTGYGKPYGLLHLLTDKIGVFSLLRIAKNGIPG